MPKAFDEFGYEMIAQKVECKAIARKGVTIIREVGNATLIASASSQMNWTVALKFIGGELPPSVFFSIQYRLGDITWKLKFELQIKYVLTVTNDTELLETDKLFTTGWKDYLPYLAPSYYKLTQGSRSKVKKVVIST